MSIKMEKKFMVCPAAAGYGHRIWLSSEEWEMITTLKPHSMWGGIDKRYSDGNGKELVSYEITPYDNGVKLDEVKDILRAGSFTEITNRDERISVFQSHWRHY